MSFLHNRYLNFPTSRIETSRCVLVPFSLDGRVDIRELNVEFCRANKNLYVSPNLPTYEEEFEYVKNAAKKITKWEEFENFILEKDSWRLLGCWGLRLLESGELNIGIWIREDEQGKGYTSEVYTAFITWARTNSSAIYLVHSLDPANEPSRKLVLKFWGVLQKEKTERGHDVYHIPL